MMITPPAWNPRWDGLLRGEWLNHLITHRGEWFHATDLWSTEDEWQRTVLRQVAREVVVAARRLGYVIDGDRRLGYCYRYSDIPRYLHLKEKDAETAEQLSPAGAAR